MAPPSRTERSRGGSPLVSIGLPVYNGEDYLEEAIRSLLGQTLDDLELIVSDNASSDRTAEICRDYQAKDGRLRYFRNERNIGASANYTRTFELASGQYFRWAAHDDVCGERFLEVCVEALDQNLEAALASPRGATIDADGKRIGGIRRQRADLRSSSAPDRFRAALQISNTAPIWGLIPRHILGRTGLLGDYPGHDRPLLAELALHGRFIEVDEVLFFNRDHPNRSIRRFDPEDALGAMAWYSPQRAGKLAFPEWRLFWEYFQAIRRAPLAIRERLQCLRALQNWAGVKKDYLARDVEIAGPRLPAGRILSKAARAWSDSARISDELAAVCPPESRLTLPSTYDILPTELERWQVVGLHDHDGVEWGPPASPDELWGDVERALATDAAFLVFPRMSFWYFDSYPGLRERLFSSCEVVWKSKLVQVFAAPKAAAAASPR